MRFAAGLTITGILGFLLMEALKTVMVPVTAWLIAALAFIIKVILIGLGLGLIVAVIAVAIFVYKRLNRHRAEA